ncbi:hypothetical protein [Natrinema marinum]|uniref:hypothetical protein n=1 Tax=Natrinema marinum TaxID=2961598 RepID=UPI0020C90B0E|nr:hypothetical protein [Natrinema marinum]
MLTVTGVAASTAFIAGCGGGSGGNGGNGGNGGTEDGSGVEIEPGTQIEFDGQTPGWVGIAPDSIADEDNPTIVLQEGETYEIGWTTGDGAQHNIEIRDENDEVVGDLSTEVVTEPEDQWLEFEASSEMATYVCQVHPNTMIGDIQVAGGGGDTTGGNETGGNMTGNETGGNETGGNMTGNETGDNMTGNETENQTG